MLVGAKDVRVVGAWDEESATGVGHGAVFLIGHVDHRKYGFVSQKPLVLRVPVSFGPCCKAHAVRCQCLVHRLELLLEAAAIDAHVGQASEAVGDLFGTGTVALGYVGEVVCSGRQAITVGVGASAPLEQDAIAPKRIDAVGVALWISDLHSASAHVAGDHTEMEVPDGRKGVAVFLHTRGQDADELGQLIGQLLLLLNHRAGVVNHEQQVDLVHSCHRHCSRNRRYRAWREGSQVLIGTTRKGQCAGKRETEYGRETARQGVLWMEHKRPRLMGVFRLSRESRAMAHEREVNESP